MNIYAALLLLQLRVTVTIILQTLLLKLYVFSQADLVSGPSEPLIFHVHLCSHSLEYIFTSVRSLEIEQRGAN